MRFNFLKLDRWWRHDQPRVTTGRNNTPRPAKAYWQRVQEDDGQVVQVLRQGGSNPTPRRKARKRQRDARRVMYARRRAG